MSTATEIMMEMEARWPAVPWDFRAVVIRYARGFHIPLTEGESLEMWMDRIRPKMQQNTSRAFMELMEAVVKEVSPGRPVLDGGALLSALSTDEFNEAIKKIIGSGPMPAGEVEANARRLYGTSPTPPTLGQQRAADAEAKRAAGWKGSDALPYDSDYDS